MTEEKQTMYLYICGGCGRRQLEPDRTLTPGCRDCGIDVRELKYCGETEPGDV